MADDTETQDRRERRGSVDVLLSAATVLAAIGTFRWDFASDEMRLSSRAAEILDLKPDDKRFSSQGVIERAIHPDDRPRAIDLRDHSRATAEAVPTGEWLVIDSSERTRWVAINMEPVRFEGARATEMVGSMRDVTEEHDWARERALFLAGSRAGVAGAKGTQNLEALVADLVKALGWEAGTLWTTDQDSKPFCRAHWSRSDSPAPAPPDGPWRSGVLTIPVAAGPRGTGTLELVQGSGSPLRPDLDQALQAVAAQLGDYLARRGGGGASPLTARETEVLQLASHGGSSATIADRLVVSTSTVKTHFEHIYTKLGVIDRAGAVAEALRRGLIE